MNLEARRGETSIRILKALVIGRGDAGNARAYAAGQGPGWREAFEAIEKAAVGGGTTGADGAGLIGPVGTDLLPVVRGLEIVNRLPGLRRIPFGIALNTTLRGVTA